MLQVVNTIDGSVSLVTTADTYVHQSNTTTNYGSDVNMVTKVDGRYALLKFDLNAVSGSIISAKLRVFQRTNFEDTRVIYDVVDDSWIEADITWNNKPAFENERARTLTNKATWSEWDVS